MMWQAKLKAWAVGLGLTAASLGGTGYLATTGVGQGPPVPGAGPARLEKPAAKVAELPVLQVDTIDYAEALQLEIDRAKLQIQRADVAIKQDQGMQRTQGIPINTLEASSIAALQAKEDKLVAERNLKLAERKLAALKGQPVAAATPVTAELRRLREQRVEAARGNWKAFHEDDLQRRTTDYVTVRLTLGIAHKLTANLLESEREAAGTPAEHVAAWRGQKARLTLIRKAVEGKLDFASSCELLDAELVAEIRLLELGAK